MQFLFGYGMFSDIWAPLAEIVINLSVAIACGAKWGLPGILLGGLTKSGINSGYLETIFSIFPRIS